MYRFTYSSHGISLNLYCGKLLNAAMTGEQCRLFGNSVTSSERQSFNNTDGLLQSSEEVVLLLNVSSVLHVHHLWLCPFDGRDS